MNPYLVGRLKEGRKKSGLTQADAAEKIGVKRSTLAGYESGNSEPTIDTYIELCKLYGLDYFSILSAAYELEPSGPEPGYVTDTERSLLEKFRQLSSFDQQTVMMLIERMLDRETEAPVWDDRIRYRGMTLYGGRPSAGTGNYLPDDMSLYHSEIQVPDTTETRKADFVLEVDGHSMEPKLNDGDRILIHRQETIHPGEIGVFLINDEVVVKQLQDGILHSLNPDYPDIRILETDTVTCFGKVIGKL